MHPDVLPVNIMEARNFITAREMIVDGNWIFTSINGLPRYEKPPLPTWMTAISMLSLGMKSLFALRLPAALMGTLVVFMTYFFCLKLTSQKIFAFIAALISASSFYIIMSGRDGQWDIFTHAFMLVSIYFLYQIFTEKSHLYRNALLAGLFFGCSFLSKGPVSLYVLFLPFLIAYSFTFRFKKMHLLWRPLVVFLLVAIISSVWWNVYIYLFDNQAVTEITTKETGRWLNYNTRPIYYYWSFVVQSGLWTIPAFVGLLYPYLKNKVFNKKAYTFTLLWTLISVILLSIIPEKKARYLMPVLIPMAMNTAFYIEYLFRSFKTMSSKKETGIVYFHFGLIALIGCAFPIAAYLYFGDTVHIFLIWYLLTSFCLLAIGIGILLFLRKKELATAFYLSIALIFSVLCFGLPLAKGITHNPQYNSIVNAKTYLEKNKAKIYEFEAFTPELIWDYGEPIEVLFDGIKYKIPKENGFYVLTNSTEEIEFEKVFANFHIQKIDSFDMNPVGIESRSHKARLQRNLYWVERF
jgi:4-amino-4-deoxy-L-arabinose transferase-like glycosyltransferase